MAPESTGKQAGEVSECDLYDEYRFPLISHTRGI